MKSVHLVYQYLEFAKTQKRLSPRTVDLYERGLKELCQFADNDGIKDLTKIKNSEVRRWIMQLNVKGFSYNSISLTLSIWRNFYKWLGEQEIIVQNPIGNTRAPKSVDLLPKALSLEEAQRLANFTNDVSQVANKENALIVCLRNAAIVELLYGSGLRVSELITLDIKPTEQSKGWIDLRDMQVHVTGKGAKRRTVPLGSKACQAITQWLDVRQKLTPNETASPALFVGKSGRRLSRNAVWLSVHKAAQNAGLDTPVHPHMLRHSFASHILQSSQDLRAVQELLGHANISTTQIYTRLDFMHLAQTYQNAHPRAKQQSLTQPSPKKTPDLIWGDQKEDQKRYS